MGELREGVHQQCWEHNGSVCNSMDDMWCSLHWDYLQVITQLFSWKACLSSSKKENNNKNMIWLIGSFVCVRLENSFYCSSEALKSVIYEKHEGEKIMKKLFVFCGRGVKLTAFLRDLIAETIKNWIWSSIDSYYDVYSNKKKKKLLYCCCYYYYLKCFR